MRLAGAALHSTLAVLDAVSRITEIDDIDQRTQRAARGSARADVLSAAADDGE